MTKATAYRKFLCEDHHHWLFALIGQTVGDLFLMSPKFTEQSERKFVGRITPGGRRLIDGHRGYEITEPIDFTEYIYKSLYYFFMSILSLFRGAPLKLAIPIYLDRDVQHKVMYFSRQISGISVGMAIRQRVK